MKKYRAKTRRRARKLKDLRPSELEKVLEKRVVLPKEENRAERKRIFDSRRVFCLFLYQILSGNMSCRETLRAAQAWLSLKGAETISASTAAYCKARGRLKATWLEEIQRLAAARLEESVEPERLWMGRRVRVVDGTGLSMPDTEENQREFPQSKRQKKGCGFPVMRVVAIFSLATGALLEVAHGSLNDSERTLFRRLWDCLKEGEIVLGDRGFTGFADFFLLKERGVDSVMRNHHRRSAGERTVRRLGRGDRLVIWKKTKVCPKWLDKSRWLALPCEMLVRRVDLRIDVPGFRTEKIAVVTTLLDARLYRPEDIAALYRRRWQAEIYLRDIKISLGMDVLKCKTPEMVLKELRMYLIAYNLIRALMFEAACEQDVDPSRLSFKGAVDGLRQWLPLLAVVHGRANVFDKMYGDLLHYIAKDIVPDRPNRMEPRARKRRPKNYQLLNKPRREFKEIQHRNKYRAGLS